MAQAKPKNSKAERKAGLPEAITCALECCARDPSSLDERVIKVCGTHYDGFVASPKQAAAAFLLAGVGPLEAFTTKMIDEKIGLVEAIEIFEAHLGFPFPGARSAPSHHLNLPPLPLTLSPSDRPSRCASAAIELKGSEALPRVQLAVPPPAVSKVAD